MPFNDRLKFLRNRKGLSQEELAKFTGMTRSAIGMYETGKRAPDIETLEVFADFFNVDMNTLLSRNTDQPLPPPPSDNFKCSEGEKTLIKKYRQLDDDGKEDVEDFVDMKLSKLQRKAEEDVKSLG